ncbi:hypothetical protein Syun_004253 [Stephania yunnanensis]|uniref:Uncharacterized protein n=1 Tax=Stephania yunnanensis TaxID=152371 RepID=A0AAP0L2Z9_9MAGN
MFLIGQEFKLKPMLLWWKAILHSSKQTQQRKSSSYRTDRGSNCACNKDLIKYDMRKMLGGDAEVPIVPATKPSMSFIKDVTALLLNLQDTTDSDSNAFINVPPTSDDDSSSDNTFIAVAQL